MNKADQRKRKAKKKNRLAPVSWKDTNKGHRLGPKRTVDELPLDQQKDTNKGHRLGPKRTVDELPLEKSRSKKKKSKEKEQACSSFMERHH